MTGSDHDRPDDSATPGDPGPPADPFALLAGFTPHAQAFRRVLVAQGFTELTEVQQAVLQPELAEADLRISSQTGSGKTVAVGFVVAGSLEIDAPSGSGGRQRTATPRGLIVAPTRELAAQLGAELSWLYGPLHVRIAVVTGGTAVGGDLRALAERPALVIGTPGRLVDHLQRGSLDLTQVAEVVLDEADEMLDMGFREELESILEHTPAERRTHLVSATFPDKVRSLADRYQREPVAVEGSVGAHHEDIHHVGIVVDTMARVDTLVNLLLAYRDQRFLVFVRTRVAATGLSGELAGLGFAAGPLSGEMAQRERTRCLADFRAHKLQCVVATDVAARGLDIRGVEKIVHYDMPENLEAFTHRSGRTGRAGDKGESILFVGPRGRWRAEELYRAAGAKVQWRKPPSPAQVRKAGRRRLLRKYGAVDPAGGPEAAASQAPEAMQKLAAELLERRPAEAVVADLLQDLGASGPTEAREIREPAPARGRPREGRRPADGRRDPAGAFVPFHVTWGAGTGANPKRLLAHLCRRGGITGKQVGAMRIHEFRSVVDIAAGAAEAFAKAAARSDPRNPRIRIERFVPHEQRRGAPDKARRPRKERG